VTDKISQTLLYQRIRNRIIEYFEATSSYEEQLAYEARVPMVFVPNEVINEWEDWFRREYLPDYVEPIFSKEEQESLGNFDQIWLSVVDDTPNPLPKLTDLIGTEPWERLRVAAEEALNVFRVRGMFDEEREEFLN